MTPDVETLLPTDTTAPARARDFLQRASCTAHHTSAVGTSVLLGSELVTNAVHHGAPPITLRLSCDVAEGLEVRVADGSSRAPVVREAGDRWTSGHGMALVQALSDAWGVTPTDAGKVVWFRLRGRASSPARRGGPQGDATTVQLGNGVEAPLPGEGP